MEPSQHLVVLGRMKARYTANTPVERGAFQSLMTDAQRAELGAHTKSPGVAGDAVRWIVQIDEDARDYPVVFDFYGTPRFAYFIESTRALVARLVAEGGKAKTRDVAKGGAAPAIATAKSTRARLVRRLETFAGARAAERKAIDDAKGSVAQPDLLAKSLLGLAALGEEWLARTDAASRVLAAAAHLDAATVAAAKAAAASLTGAAADATEAGRASAKDSPAVNVAEGTVLHEMAVAMAALDEAHEEHPEIRRLVPGPATRRVLAPSRAAKAEDAGAPVDAPVGKGAPDK